MFSDRDRRSIIRFCKENPFDSSLDISKEFNKFSGKSISPQMVRRILLTVGLRSYAAKKKPFLTPRMIRARKAFCNLYKDKTVDFWKKVFYSDESYISINMNSSMNTVRRFSY